MKADAQEEVGQQYKYMGKLEGVLECMEQQGCARQLRNDLRLLRTSRPADSREQRIRALKARIAIANRCHGGLQVRFCQGPLWNCPHLLCWQSLLLCSAFMAFKTSLALFALLPQLSAGILC